MIQFMLQRFSPLQKQILIAAGIVVVGDLSAQRLEGKMPVDYARTARFLLIRTCFITPGIWFFMKRVDKRFFHEAWAKGVMKKVICDAAILQPFLCCGFFTLMSLLEGNSPIDRLRGAYLSTVVRGWMFWMPVDVLLYGFLPIYYRIPVAQVASLLWTTYISNVNQKCKEKAEDTTYLLNLDK